MPEPADYMEAAHVLARGRNHRLRFQEEPEEVEDPDTGARGAWVPIDVWVCADEVERILATKATSTEGERDGTLPKED